MRHLIPCALLGLLPAGLASCMYCTQMWAPSTVTIDIEHADPWRPGTYEIEANGYSQHAMCVVTLPHEEGDLVSCTGNAQVEFTEDGQGLARFTLYAFHPEGFGVEVLKDGEFYAEDGYQPEYAVDEPNGPGCGERHVASLVLAL